MCWTRFIAHYLALLFVFLVSSPFDMARGIQLLKVVYKHMTVDAPHFSPIVAGLHVVRKLGCPLAGCHVLAALLWFP